MKWPGRHHLADEVATSTEAAPGNGIIASCWGSAVSQPRSTELLGAVSPVGKECGMVKSSLWGRRHGR